MGGWPGIALNFALVCLESQFPEANATERGGVSAGETATLFRAKGPFMRNAWPNPAGRLKNAIGYVAQSLRRLRFTGNSVLTASASRMIYGHRDVALISDGRDQECESAERRRLRSSVAPTTEILQEQRADSVKVDLWSPRCGVDFGRA